MPTFAEAKARAEYIPNGGVAMNQVLMQATALVALPALLALSACANSPAQLRSPQPGDSLPCEEALTLQTADAHPDIRWAAAAENVSQAKFASCLLSSKTDSATIEVRAYLTSDLYKFIGECREREDVRAVSRVFEYRNKDRPYPLRLHTTRFVEPYTYVVVISYPKGSSGSFHHSVTSKTNDYEKVTPCLSMTPA